MKSIRLCMSAHRHLPKTSSCYGQRMTLSTSGFNRTVEKLESGDGLDKSLQDIIDSKQLTSIEDFREDMKPFLKEVFCGNFNTLVMSYPDVLPNDRYHHLEQKILDIRESLSQRKDLLQLIVTENKISKDLLLSLRSNGIFGLRGPVLYGGQGYCLTESLRCIEEVASKNINLSNVIVNSSWYAGQMVSLFGSEELKTEYLTKIYQGTAMASLCVADQHAGCDPNSTEATVYEHKSEGYMTMKFDKLWVTNAVNTDLFIVLAKRLSRDDHSSSLNAYLVDRQNSSEGSIVVDKRTYPTKGLKTSGISTVCFNDVEVPLKNQIGFDGQGFHMLTETLKSEAKLASSVQILAALRKAIDFTVEHTTERRAFGAELKSFDLVHDKIGKCVLHIYALESAIYLTAGLADYQKEPDIAMESTACKILAYNAASYCLEVCRTLFGADTYLQDNGIMQIFSDIEGLLWWESCNDMNKLYLSLGGLSYTAENRQENVRKMTSLGIVDLLSIKGQKKKWNNSPKLVHKIYEDVHPSLVEVAKTLETIVLNFDAAIGEFLAEHGANVQLAEIDLDRIGKIAADIYGLTAVLARASRSYCDGHRHGDLELKKSGAYVFYMEPSIAKEIQELRAPNVQKNDPFIKYISNYSFEHGGYPTSHPLTKNMF